MVRQVGRDVVHLPPERHPPVVRLVVQSHLRGGDVASEGRPPPLGQVLGPAEEGHPVVQAEARPDDRAALRASAGVFGIAALLGGQCCVVHFIYLTDKPRGVLLRTFCIMPDYIIWVRLFINHGNLARFSDISRRKPSISLSNVRII